MNMRIPWVAMLALAAAACWPSLASAQALGCQVVSAQPVLDFGRPGANPTAQVDTTTSVQVRCTGFFQPGLQVKVCLGLPAGVDNALVPLRRMANAGARLNYQIYSDASRSVIWGPLAGVVAPPATVQLTLNQGNVFFPYGEATVQMYGRIMPGQSGLPAGSYSSVMSGAQLASSPTLSQSCTSMPVWETFTARAQATLPGSCTIIANDLGFGLRNDLSIAVDATTSIGLTCTDGTAYQVRLDGGTITGNVAARAMGLGGNPPGAIDYQLYRDPNRTQVWGDGSAGTTTVIGTGTGTGNPVTLTVYGRVPAQPTPPAGYYLDVVTATVVY